MDIAPPGSDPPVSPRPLAETTPSPGPAPSLRHFPALALSFGVGAVLVLWTVIALGLASLERSEKASAHRVLANLARSFEGHVERSLDNIDQILAAVALSVAREGFPDDLGDILGDRVGGDPLFHELAVADAQGKVRVRGGSGSGDSLEGQPFFTRQRERPDGGLLVSEPAAGAVPGRVSVILSHRVSGGDGNFGGVVVASVAPEYFTRFYSSFDLGAGGSVALVSLDGKVRARHVRPSASGAFPRQDEALAPSTLREVLQRNPQGTLQGPSPVDGVSRLYAYRVMERYPFAVVVGMGEDHALADLATRRMEWTGLGAAVSLVILGLTAVLYRRSLRLCEAEERTRAALEQVRLSAKVFEESSDGIMICDGENRILTVNRAFTTITGYGAEEVIGRNPRFLGSGATPRETYQEMWCSLRESGSWHGEVVNRRKDGEKYPEWLSVCEVRDSKGTLTHHIGIFSDATAHKFDGRRLHFLVHYDTLTELPNRLLLGDRLSQAVAGARRTGKSVAVLFIDLDNFKPVNDTYGHEAGDRLLKAVASRLHSVIRETDTLARLGGDEFVLVMPELDFDGHAEVVAEKCRTVFDAPFVIAGNEIRAAASIGIARYPLDGTDPQSLLEAADRAMYAAKEAEKGATRALSRRAH